MQSTHPSTAVVKSPTPSQRERLYSDSLEDLLTSAERDADTEAPIEELSYDNIPSQYSAPFHHLHLGSYPPSTTTTTNHNNDSTNAIPDSHSLLPPLPLLLSYPHSPEVIVALHEHAAAQDSRIFHMYQAINQSRNAIRNQYNSNSNDELNSTDNKGITTSSQRRVLPGNIAGTGKGTMALMALLSNLVQRRLFSLKMGIEGWITFINYQHSSQRYSQERSSRVTAQRRLQLMEMEMFRAGVTPPVWDQMIAGVEDVMDSKASSVNSQQRSRRFILRSPLSSQSQSPKSTSYTLPPPAPRRRLFEEALYYTIRQREQMMTCLMGDMIELRQAITDDQRLLCSVIDTYKHKESQLNQSMASTQKRLQERDSTVTTLQQAIQEMESTTMVHLSRLRALEIEVTTLRSALTVTNNHIDISSSSVFYGAVDSDGERGSCRRRDDGDVYAYDVGVGAMYMDGDTMP